MKIKVFIEMEKKSVYTKEEQERLNEILNMTPKERHELAKQHSILLEQQQFKPEDLKHFDMTNEEFCRTYGYVNLDDILSNNRIVKN